MRRKIREGAQAGAEFSVRNPRLQRPQPEAYLGILAQKPFHQLWKCDILREVAAVGRNLNPRDHNLMDTRLCQPPRFRIRRLGRHGTHMPAQVRDDAVGTIIVAPVLYLEQRSRPPSGDTRPQQLKTVRLRRFQPVTAARLMDSLLTGGNHCRAVRGAANQVYLARRPQPFRAALREASARGQHRAWVVPAQPVDGAEVFMLAGRCDRTGVQDHRVSVLCNQNMPAFPCQLRQRLCFK